MKATVKYLSQRAADQLYGSVADNLERYISGDFKDLAEGRNNSIELSNNLDLDPLKDLVTDKSPEAEIANTVIIWKVFNGLQPSLARENRLWTRLCHVECLEYARGRWLNPTTMKQEELIKGIKTHFFANTQTKCRDDNAISRLWWNAYIAKLAAPEDQENAIRQILKTADIRSNFIERSRTVSRPIIAAGIVRMMIGDAWISEKESNFREFMKVLNRQGGGKVFELWTKSKIDKFLTDCQAMVRSKIEASK